MNKIIFISHSHEDLLLANEMVSFLEKLGIPTKDIFCSSVEGQGVKSGERIPDVVKDTLAQSTIVFFILSKPFLVSPFCLQELGTAWSFRDKKYIVFKCDDVESKDLKGFFGSDYKYLSLNPNGLFEAVDEINEVCSLPAIKHTTLNRYVEDFFRNTEIAIAELVEKKKKSTKVLEKERIDRLVETYKFLSSGEKEILALLFFSKNRSAILPIRNATVGLLENKFFIFRTTSMSTGLLGFGFSLQPWFLEHVITNKNIEDDLRKHYKKNNDIEIFDDF